MGKTIAANQRKRRSNPPLQQDGIAAPTPPADPGGAGVSLAQAGGPPGSTDDGGLAYRTIIGELSSSDALLRLIAERIRIAARHLALTREDLQRIFIRHTVFEGETLSIAQAAGVGFILVETHHLILPGRLRPSTPPERNRRQTARR